MKRKILLIVVVVIIAIQFVPYGRNHSNPDVVAEPSWDSPQTRETFFRLCGDCHSHETSWPFYSHIAPVSWLVQMDVNKGRGHFNVSMWNAQEKNEGDEAAEEYEEGKMPLWIYRISRPQNRLSQAERAAFIKGLRATFRENEPHNEQSEEH